jgi:hypothetical protein
MEINRDILATTLENYSATMIKNLPKMSPALNRVAKRGNSTSNGWKGRLFRQSLEYGLNGNVMFMTGAQPFAVKKTNAFEFADFHLRQLVGTVVIEGVEEVMNDGEEAQTNYLEAKVSNLETSLQQITAESFYFDGTEYGGLAFSGINEFIVKMNALGSVGGLDRSIMDQRGRTWWRNQVLLLSGPAGPNVLPPPVVGGPNVRTMTRALNRLHLKVKNGADLPDICLMGDGHYTDYIEEIQEKQMFTTTDKEDAGFGYSSVRYGPLNISVINDSVAPDQRFTNLLNTKYVFQRKSKRWMKKLPNARPVNQDISAHTIIGDGNMTIGNMERQGLLLDA